MFWKRPQKQNLEDAVSHLTLDVCALTTLVEDLKATVDRLAERLVYQQASTICPTPLSMLTGFNSANAPAWVPLVS